MHAVVLLILVTVLVTPIDIVRIVADPQVSTTVFVDPPTIKDKVIGETVTVDIKVSNVTHLYGWQVGLTFNPEVLNCTGYYEGEFLKRGLDPEDPNVGTFWINRTPPWDNTKGIVYFHGCTRLGQITGASGSGQLAYITFEVIGTGISDLHLTDVILGGYDGEDLFEIPFEVVDAFTVPWGGFDYSVEIASNLTGIDDPPNPPESGLFNHTFGPQEKTVTFDVITHHEGFYEVTIPKDILECGNLSEWNVTVDGSPITCVPTESPTATSLYFKYHNGTHKVEITGTVLGTPGDIAPEFGVVDVMDVLIVALAFGSKPSDENWNPIADLYPQGSGDEEIDSMDILQVALHFGQTYP